MKKWIYLVCFEYVRTSSREVILTKQASNLEELQRAVKEVLKNEGSFTMGGDARILSFQLLRVEDGKEVFVPITAVQLIERSTT